MQGYCSSPVYRSFLAIAICQSMKKLLCVSLLLAGNAWAGGVTLTTENAPPYNFSNDGGKTVVGSATETVQELFQRAHIPYKIKMYPWVRALDMARFEADTCVFSTTRTPEREKTFQWVGPLAPNSWVFFARADSTIRLNLLDDARKFRVGGYRGDAVTLYLEEHQFTIDEGADDEQNARKLQAGRIELWATESQAGWFVAAKLNVQIKPLLEIKKTALYLACNAGVAPQTIALLNTTLQAMVKDGTIEKIGKKYR